MSGAIPKVVQQDLSGELHKSRLPPQTIGDCQVEVEKACPKHGSLFYFIDQEVNLFFSLWHERPESLPQV